MPHQLKLQGLSRGGLGWAAAIGLLMASMTSSAATLTANVQGETQINNQAEASQERVNQLAEETDTLLQQYRQATREADTLKIYNDQLERVVADQRQSVSRIERELENLSDTQQTVVPLMLEMVDMLERIVQADIPFRKAERERRIANLKANMDDSSITDSERFRVIMETYQTELEYGRTTETYDGTLPDGSVVDFLRVGRTLLLYQSQDGEATGWWDSEAGEFVALDGEYRQAVADGIAIAGNLKAPNLVKLPVPGPEQES